MRLTQSEIRANAIRFAADWRDGANERADAQTFWTELFAVFGVKRRSVASFEEKVKNLKGAYDRIDVFYAGVMLGEHKSKGQDLSKAASQAFNYIQSLTREGRTADLPQYIVVSDFDRIVIYDLDAADPSTPLADFKVAKLHDNLKHLGFLGGYVTRPVDPEDPINIEAVTKLGSLHDALERGGYTGHALERFLVRILFCLFADDTQIFEPDLFKTLLKESRTDGSDLGATLAHLFDILDKPKNHPSRQALPEHLKTLPYVNGELFKENLGFANFNTEMRDALIECSESNWSRISPAVFGSLFQSIMAGEAGAKKRRQIGAHYTSERDIMKLVRSLFLDDLKAELEAIGKDKKKLNAFQDKLASLRFLDPACGCGNFLVITYRELRLLELEALWRIHKQTGEAQGAQTLLNLDHILKINVDQMHGIEIEEWPARIAEVAMWLIDHQMNQLVCEKFGIAGERLPLIKSAKIAHANALRTDWNTVLPAKQCSYVLGNPPFIGHHLQTAEQKADQNRIWSELDASGVLDFVTCWYRVATSYIQGTAIQCAFVSTNSISQGEQPGIFWPLLLQKGVVINFAHRTFKWTSEARGKAHVHVVIIGFAVADRKAKHIWDYEQDDGDKGTRHEASTINPYLFEGPSVLLTNRRHPICTVPGMKYGSKPTDDGNFLMTPDERAELLRVEPGAKKWIRQYIGATEFLDGVDRYCLWLADITPAELRSLPHVSARVEAVRKFRSESVAQTTREYADYPTLFRQIAQPSSRYILVPGHTSETRQYIPFAYFGPTVIASNACFLIPDAGLWHFGVISSAMHMAWVRQFCGRLESRYRYSKDIVYNNFPWPQDPTDKQKAAVEESAQAVLDARTSCGYNPEGGGTATLADLYDPLAMPKMLRNAHKALDRAVDKCYRAAPFESERKRIEYLFDLYQKLTTPLTAPTRSRSRPASKTKKPRTKRT